MITKQSENTPIGVFDSGLGGLTVLRSLEKILPNESFIYLGDTAHVPYGTKSAETVTKYSKNIMDFFIQHETKAIVIACNTASSVALNHLQNIYDIPLFDVVSPSVEYSMKISKNNKIGVIGTTSTIHSKAYSCMFAKLSSKYSIYELQCPLFVPIIEEGWSDSPVAKQIATIYLHDFTNKNIDTLILGCTHYPIMANTIKSVISKNIQLVHSGETVGYKLLNYLKKTGNDNSYSSNKKIKYFVTDLPQKFDELGSRFLGRQLIDVQHIYL